MNGLSCSEESNKVVGSSRTRGQTCVPLIGRRILIHYATRQVLLCFISLCVELCTLQGLPPSLLVDFLFRKGRGVNGHFRFDLTAQSQLLFKSSLPFLFGSWKRKRIFSPPSMGDEGVRGRSELVRRDLGNHCRINLQNSTPAP